jgi:hypothetical protein
MKLQELRQLIRKEIKSVINEAITPGRYSHSGVSSEKAEMITKNLSAKLKSSNIPFVEDRKYAMEMYDEPKLYLKIINPKNNMPVYVTYDEFDGYVIEGEGLTDEGIVNGSLGETIAYIRNMLSRLKK